VAPALHRQYLRCPKSTLALCPQGVKLGGRWSGGCHL